LIIDGLILCLSAIGLVALAGVVRIWKLKRHGAMIIIYLLIALAAGRLIYNHSSSQTANAHRRTDVLRTLKPFCRDYHCRIVSLDVNSLSATLAFGNDCQSSVGFFEVGRYVLRPSSTDFNDPCAARYVTDLP
jgi:hypothetical protein